MLVAHRSPDPCHDLAISVVITTHNEGCELLRTVKSIQRNTERLHEIIVVDDGSTDGHCTGLEAYGIKVIGHASREGVAISRHQATQLATGNVVAYLDGHQRVSRRSRSVRRSGLQPSRGR